MASPTPVTLQRLQCLSALVAATTLLAACGGGSSAPTPPPPPPPPPAATLSLTGTAATGAAIAGATVTAKCNGGTGTATTAAKGTYSIALTAGTLPCVLKVTRTAGDLYSVATGTGATATANITPFTQMIVANQTGKDPAAYFTDFGAADITALTSSSVSTAQAAVVAVLKNNGIDTASLPVDLIAGALVAATGSTAGNAYDLALDALNAKLTSSGTTLEQLTAVVVQTSTSIATAAPSGTPSVALDVALQPQAATCAALRSGTYRVIVPEVAAAGTYGNASTEKVTINATAPSIIYATGEVSTLTPTAGSPCRFSSSGGGDIVVSQSGVFGVYTGDGFFGVGFPEQAIALADLAGNWNFAGYNRDLQSDPLGPTTLTGSMSSAGVLTIASFCWDAKTCETTGLPTPVLTVNAAGGYDFTITATEKQRLFAFRTGGGELMLALVGEGGTLSFATRRRTLTLPTVGTVNLFWNVDVVNQLSGTAYLQKGVAITNGSNTITSIDAVNDRFTRDNVTNFATTPPTTRPETIYSNAVAGTARQGYRWRAPQTGVVNSAGATVNVPEFIQLPLRGTGLTIALLPGANPAASRLGMSVGKP